MRAVSFVLCLALATLVVDAHICLIYPAQRGTPFNPSGAQPGEDMCFQTKEPCGDRPAGSPVATLVGNTTFQVKFQQNLNHFDVGFGGYLDVAVGRGNPTSDQDFMVVAAFNDYWAHQQWQQTNFSVSFVVPNVDCNDCILRFRYHSNKPTEPTYFRQCSDVAIVANPGAPQKKMYAVSSSNMNTDDARLVEITASGQVLKTGPYVNTGHAMMSRYIAQGVVAPASTSANGNGLVFLGGNTLTRGQIFPETVFLWDTKTSRSLSIINQNVSIKGRQLCSLIPISNAADAPMIAVAQSEGVDTFSYLVYLISPTGKTAPKLIATTPLTDVYVNFFWATYNAEDGLVYILSGHENEPVKLNTAIYTVNIKTGATSNVTIEAPQWTYDHIHYDPASELLLSISQGTLGDNDWAIVSTNPATGAVNKLFSVDGAKFESLYGGAVIQTLDSTGLLYHTFRNSVTDALSLNVFNLLKGGVLVYSTDIDIGLNQKDFITTMIAL